MAIKKSQLYKTIWDSCDALRGSMDASQYKDYVLIILFVRYLSDKVPTKQIKVIRIPEGCYFKDFVKLKQGENIGEEINKKLEKIKKANSSYIGDLALPDFNDGTKLGNENTRRDTLSELIAVFDNDNLDFSKNRAADDDLLGDAYEYLVKNFAVQGGKSKGQFYTPAEVSRVIAKVLHMEEFSNASNSIYDMTCGSGSLLLRALSETPSDKPKPKLYGQEKDSTTASLAKLNMLLHGIVNANIKIGDTLNDPAFVDNMGMLRAFDVCVANPPFSLKKWLSAGNKKDRFGRWRDEPKDGKPKIMPPDKCGDFAFLLHFLASMKSGTGRGACVLPHGVLFRGNTEYDIRKHIVDRHYICGIIGLPPNLFFGTGIPACILILDKKDLHSRKGIFFIDAKEGFIKDGNKNRLREQDIKRIVDVWNTQEDVPHYARMVSWKEIEDNDYNLNIPRYIQPRNKELPQDIEAHLYGGIPEHDVSSMKHSWTVCPSLKDALFNKRQDGRYDLAVDKAKIALTIRQNDSFCEQQKVFDGSLNTWAKEVRPLMKSIDKDCHPKKLIDDWSERLLDIAKEDKSLAEPYAVYDRLMNYWAETMQDDCYMVSNDGWVFSYNTGTKKKWIYTDIVCDLLPVEVLLRVFFTEEMEEISNAQQVVEDRLLDMDSYVDEHPETFDDIRKEDEGKKSGGKKNSCKVSEKDVRTALKEAEDSTDEETAKELEKFIELLNDKKKAAKKLNELQVALTKKVVAKYDSLNTKPEELKHLVVEEKWLYDVVNTCQEEMKNIAQSMASTVTTLATRYEQTLPKIRDAVAKHEQEVDSFLKQMGFKFF